MSNNDGQNIVAGKIRQPQWNPIATAPKDGSNVLVLMHNGKLLVAHWASDMKGWFRAVTDENGSVLYYEQIDTPAGWRPTDQAND